jgi:hypothetical protein
MKRLAMFAAAASLLSVAAFAETWNGTLVDVMYQEVRAGLRQERLRSGDQRRQVREIRRSWQRQSPGSAESQRQGKGSEGPSRGCCRR